jgi:hypothetical protein
MHVFKDCLGQVLELEPNFAENWSEAMSKPHLLISAATATFLITGLIAGGNSGAFAQDLCEYMPSLTSDTLTHHGYSNKLAQPGARGTSTVVVTTGTISESNCPAGTSGTVAITINDYTQGPGKSPFDDHDSSTCETISGNAPCP